jgi:iron complex transport system substrate-binding protein
MLQSVSIRAAIALCILGSSMAAAQVAVTDDLQRSVTLRAPAQRIVSLAPSITESLFSIGAGFQVVGVTDYCNYPPEAKLKPHVGGMTTPSIETIAALRPDLILVSMEGNLREDFSNLTALGVPVAVTNPRSLEGIYASLTMLGKLTGNVDSAAHVVAALRAREKSIARAVAPNAPRVLLLVSIQPLIAAGDRTFITELLSRAGAHNVAAGVKMTYPTLNREAVVQDDPDVIFVMSDVLSTPEALVQMYPEWKRLSAVRNGRVHRINADIVSRPGPRAVDGLQILSSFIHRNRP